MIRFILLLLTLYTVWQWFVKPFLEGHSEGGNKQSPSSPPQKRQRASKGRDEDYTDYEEIK